MESFWAFLRSAMRNIVHSPLTSTLVSPAIGVEVLHFFGVHIPGFSDADLWTHIVVISASLAGLIAGDPHLSDRARAAVGRVLLAGLLAGGVLAGADQARAESPWQRVEHKVERKIAQIRREPLVRKLRADAARLRDDLAEAREDRRAALRDAAQLAADVDRLNRELAERAAELLERGLCHRDDAPHVTPRPACGPGQEPVCVLRRKG